jgi:hypothetical protein
MRFGSVHARGKGLSAGEARLSSGKILHRGKKKWVVSYLVEKGKPARKKYFDKKSDAEHWMGDWKEGWQRETETGTSNRATDAELHAVRDFRHDLAELGVSLRDALLAYVDREKVIRASIPVEDLCGEAWTEAARLGRSRIHRDRLHTHFGRFQKAFEGRDLPFPENPTP